LHPRVFPFHHHLNRSINAYTLYSEKQYKDRLAAWNIRKNIKAKEVNVMIRKQAKRAARGKQTVFRVAGQKVDTKRIARFQRRYQNGTSWDAGHETPGRPVESHRESPEPGAPFTASIFQQRYVDVRIATPSDMSYYTPEPDERATTLSPHPESHPHHSENSVAFLSGGRASQGTPVNRRNRAVETLDPIHDPEQDDTNSMTLSPSNTSTYANQFPDERYSVTEEGALSRFQRRLMELDQRFEKDTAHLFPLEEPTTYSSKPDNNFLS
jgi:hypothetical protein